MYIYAHKCSHTCMLKYMYSIPVCNIQHYVKYRIDIYILLYTKCINMLCKQFILCLQYTILSIYLFLEDILSNQFCKPSCAKYLSE